MRDDGRPTASDVVTGVVMLAAASVCLLVALPIALGRGESPVAVLAFLAVTIALAAVGVALLLPMRRRRRAGPFGIGIVVATLGVLGAACLIDPAALTASVGARGPSSPTVTVVVGVLLLAGAATALVVGLRSLRRPRDGHPDD